MWFDTGFLSYELIPEKLFPVLTTLVALIQLFASLGPFKRDHFIASVQGVASLTVEAVQQHTGQSKENLAREISI